MPAFANAIVNGGEDYREQALRYFPDRLRMLRELVAHLSAHSPVPLDATQFPAGYFCAASASRANGMGAQVAAALAENQPPFAVVWGVDGWTPLSKTELKRGLTGYPF